MTAALYETPTVFRASSENRANTAGFQPHTAIKRSTVTISSAADRVRVQRPATRRIRLTRRGRRFVAAAVSMAFVTLVALVVLLVGALTSSSVAASTDTQTGVSTTAIVVRAGQSLWEIASEVNPSGDPRATMEQISVLNGMGSDTTVQAGQVLQVPVIK